MIQKICASNMGICAKSNNKKFNEKIQNTPIQNSLMVSDTFASKVSFSGSASKEVLNLYKKANSIAKSDWQEATDILFDATSRRLNEIVHDSDVSLDDAMALRLASARFMDNATSDNEKIVKLSVPLREHAVETLLPIAEIGYKMKGKNSLRGQTLLEKALCRLMIDPTQQVGNADISKSIQEFNEGKALLNNFGYVNGHNSDIFSKEFQGLVYHDSKSTKEMSTQLQSMVDDISQNRRNTKAAGAGLLVGKILKILIGL